MLKLTFTMKNLAATLLLLLINYSFSFGQTLPYTINNQSEFSDNDIYVAVVGITDGHVWVDARTGAVNHMRESDNVMHGPEINGNRGPGNNALYANCFTRLSDIPNRTINLPQIAGCRILISFESPLYLYFFGHSGARSGYAAPDLANETDPNQGIKFEVIELTYNNYGLWCNTTRVDFFQYPMGLEVWGDNFYKRVGEIKSRNEIFAMWKSQVPEPFKSCYDESKQIIHFPSKSNLFPSDYFNDYIDAIWNKYRHDELVFNSGDAGVWRGRVNGDVFTFHRESDNQVAYIFGKPTQQEALEGSGYFASGATFDLVVQAQMCAAINRHALDLNLPSGAMQDFGNTSKYYQTEKYNWYCKFFHYSSISHDSQTYTFCYDDVFDQSATVHTPRPQNIKITIGGFVNDNGPENPGNNDNNNNNNGGDAIRIEAENYTVMNGVDVEQCYDVGGGYNVGWIDAGDWMVWDVNIPSDGEYLVSFRVASESGGGKIQFEQAGGNPVYGIIDVPNTGGWQNWTTISHTATLQDGNQQIAIYVPQGGYNLNWIEISKQGSSNDIFIEAEDYVVMNGVETEECYDAGGGYNVGWIDAGDWMVWDVDIPHDGNYYVSYRVASESGGGKIQFERAGGNPIYGVIDVPSTGGWQNWTTIGHELFLYGGQQQVAIYVPQGGYNLNWINISSVGLKRQALSTGVESVSDNVQVYPNPAQDYVYVINNDNNSTISVYSMTGEKVLITNENKVNVSTLASGVYILSYYKDGKSESVKVVKK